MSEFRFSESGWEDVDRIPDGRYVLAFNFETFSIVKLEIYGVPFVCEAKKTFQIPARYATSQMKTTT